MVNNFTSSQQLNSLEALMSGTIDYAGIFPPGDLPLEEAINNYRKYLDDNDVWMLRSFVLPISKLKELEKHMKLFSEDKKIQLSLVVSKSKSTDEFKQICLQDLEKINSYLDKYKNIVHVSSLEIPLPPVDISIGVLESVSYLASSLNTKAFCEMTRPLSQDWIVNMKEVMKTIKEFNLNSPDHVIGYKLRSGGVKAELFPTAEQVAFVLSESINKGIPIKFTAGLHHPIRMYRNEVQTKMHGFLNIFIGYILQKHNGLDVKQIEEILCDVNGANFKLTDQEIKWKNYKADLKEIRNIRDNLLRSFGSCSFDEPREDLENLGIMK
jgi:hypothetical protein